MVILIIATIFIMLILLLAIPVDLVITLKRDGAWRGRIVVYWLFGLTQKTMRPRRESRGRHLKRRRSFKKSIVPASRQLIKRRRYLVSILRSEGFIRQLIYLFRDLLRSMKPRRFQIQCIMGLDDPADTGRLMSLLAPLRVITRKISFGQNSNVHFQVVPDFSGPRFKGHCCASVHIVPLKLIGIFLRFLFSAPVMRAAKVLILESKA